jgi:uncharacterized protein YgbK (DUF1537 family)
MGVLIVADDLSGAADCAAGFASAGHRAIVAVDPDGSVPDDPSCILSVDTDTRRLSPDAAADYTAAVCRKFLSGSSRRLYKKIDSTLRGHWAAEVAGLRAMAGMAIVAPAYPAMGRTVRGGQVYVHGEPVEQTETWRLEHHGRRAGLAAPLLEAGLSVDALDADALHDQPAALTERIEQAMARGLDALIVDAGSAGALQALARATWPIRAGLFWVGSGGLAREIAMLGPAAGALPADDVFPARGPVLILVGSLSAVSMRQAAAFGGHPEVEVISLPTQVLRSGPPHERWSALQARVGARLRAGGDLMLRIGRDDAFDPAEGAALSLALARLVAPHFPRIGGLIATGGETARAMLVGADIPALELHGELEPGIAVGRPAGVGRSHRPWIVTKAGAFGHDVSLLRAWSQLRDRLGATGGITGGGAPWRPATNTLPPGNQS